MAEAGSRKRGRIPDAPVGIAELMDRHVEAKTRRTLQGDIDRRVRQIQARDQAESQRQRLAFLAHERHWAGVAAARAAEMARLAPRQPETSAEEMYIAAGPFAVGDPRAALSLAEFRVDPAPHVDLLAAKRELQRLLRPEEGASLAAGGLPLRQRQEAFGRLMEAIDSASLLVRHRMPERAEIRGMSDERMSLGGYDDTLYGSYETVMQLVRAKAIPDSSLAVIHLFLALHNAMFSEMINPPRYKPQLLGFWKAATAMIVYVRGREHNDPALWRMMDGDAIVGGLKMMVANDHGHLEDIIGYHRISREVRAGLGRIDIRLMQMMYPWYMELVLLENQVYPGPVVAAEDVVVNGRITLGEMYNQKDYIKDLFDYEQENMRISRDRLLRYFVGRMSQYQREQRGLSLSVSDAHMPAGYLSEGIGLLEESSTPAMRKLLHTRVAMRNVADFVGYQRRRAKRRPAATRAKATRSKRSARPKARKARKKPRK